MNFSYRCAYQGICTAHTERRVLIRKYSVCIVVLMLLFLSAFFSPVCFAQESEESRDKVYVFKSDLDCPPFEYVDNGRLQGFNVEVLETVAQIMSLNIRFEWGVWADIRAELEAGEIDGLTGMMYSEERSKIISFSAPFNTLSYALFTHRDNAARSVDEIGEGDYCRAEG
jgi:ABC-type amino acid transport substrate-binding protein